MRANPFSHRLCVMEESKSGTHRRVAGVLVMEGPMPVLSKGQRSTPGGIQKAPQLFANPTLAEALLGLLRPASRPQGWQDPQTSQMTAEGSSFRAFISQTASLTRTGLC